MDLWYEEELTQDEVDALHALRDREPFGELMLLPELTEYLCIHRLLQRLWS